MALEDGRTLISHQRFEELLKTHSIEELNLLKIYPVHKNFRVIALGLPVPLYEGNPLDPPLRSRFQALKVDFPKIENVYEELVMKFPNLDKRAIQILLKFSQSIMLMIQEKSNIPPFSVFQLRNFLQILTNFGTILTKKEIVQLLMSVYPFKFIKNIQEEDLKVIEKAFDECIEELLKIIPVKSQSLQLSKAEPVGEGKAKITFGEDFQITLTPGLSNQFQFDENFIPLDYQMDILQNMLMSHAIGRDICLIGNAASGKSILCRAFTSILGYKVQYFPLYAEMTTRDLLQRRITDDKGKSLIDQ